MIKHIVLWKLKPNAEGKTVDENAAFMKEKLEGLYGKIPEIISIQVQPNTLKIDGNYDVSLIAEFESEEAMRVYQKHPLHEEIAVYVRSIDEKRAAIDYEF